MNQKWYNQQEERKYKISGCSNCTLSGVYPTDFRPATVHQYEFMTLQTLLVKYFDEVSTFLITNKMSVLGCIFSIGLEAKFI
jgi:hypothetical protein